MKKIFKNIDKPLLIISSILFLFGLIMIFSSSNIMAFMKQNVPPYWYFYKQAVFLIIGLIGSLIFIRFSTKSYGVLNTILIVLILGGLFSLRLYGTLKNQAQSWFDLGVISIQPSEVAKIVIIMWIASYYEDNKKTINTYKTIFFPIVVSGIIGLLILAQPDFGTGFIFLMIVFFIFFISPIDKVVKNKSIMIIGGGIITVLFVFLVAGKQLLLQRQLARFDFKEPCSSEKFYTIGNQVCNGYIAINNGKLFGVGLGKSTQKYLYLPEGHTDFIAAITMEELGYMSLVFLSILYILLIGRIIKIGKSSYSDRGAIMCYAVAFYIILHIAINLLGLLGLIPTTGVPLPFISYGGTFMICLIIALTIVQRVNYETKIMEERKKG